MKYPPHEKLVIPIRTAGARIVTCLSTEPVSLHLHVTIGYQHIKAFWYFLPDEWYKTMVLVLRGSLFFVNRIGTNNTNLRAFEPELQPL